MNKGSNFLLNTGMTVAMIIFLICASTWFVLGFTPIYSLQCEVFNIPGYSGYDLATCLRNYQVLIDYNMFWGAPILSFPDLAMSAEGAYHFKEVKDIFVTMQYAAIASGLLLIPGIIYCRKEKIYRWEKAVVVTALSMVAMVGLAILIDWEQTFILFHKLVFSNDFWLFDGNTDPVIWILPDEVFMTDAILIMLLVVAGLTACGLLYRKHDEEQRLAKTRKTAGKAKKKSGTTAKKSGTTAKKSGKSGAKKR